MVFKEFIKYLKFIIEHFKWSFIVLSSLSVITAIADLILLYSITKLVENPEAVEKYTNLSYIKILLISILLRFIFYTLFMFLLKDIMTNINLKVLKQVFINISKLTNKRLFQLNPEELKGITSFQTNQINQIVVLPFIRMIPDFFLLIVMLYFLVNFPIDVILYFSGIIIFYLLFVYLTNKKIKHNSLLIFNQFRSIIFYTENFFNGKIDFKSIDNYSYDKEVDLLYKSHQKRTNNSVFLGNYKRVVLELIMYSFLIFVIAFELISISQLAILFFVLVKLIPITNNANLFFNNASLNKDILIKVNKAIDGDF